MTNIKWGDWGDHREYNIRNILINYCHVIGNNCIIRINHTDLFTNKQFSRLFDSSKVYNVMGSDCPAEFIGCRFMDTKKVDSMKSIAINLAHTNDLIYESEALKKLPVDYRVIIVEKNKEKAEERTDVLVLSVEELEEYVAIKFENPLPMVLKKK